MLKVKVQPIGAIGVIEEFYARTSRDRCITTPKLLVDLLREDLEEKDSLVGYA